MQRTILAMVLLAAVIGTAAFVWKRHAATTAAVASLQRQCDDLRGQLEARDQAISEIRASLEQVPQSGPGPSSLRHATATVPGTSIEADLIRRLAELSVLQSNTLALVERLMARAGESQAAPESAREREARVAGLELSAAEFQQKLDLTKQRVAELLTSLNIPAEVSTMEVTKGLDTAALRPYAAFFEAKRERDEMQFLMERLRARLLQEHLDRKAAAQKE